MTPTPNIRPMARQYAVPLRFAGQETDQHFTVAAASTRDAIALESFLEDLASRQTARIIAEESIEHIAPRLIEWRDGNTVILPRGADQAMVRARLLDILEPMDLVQLAVAIQAMQHLSYGQKKSSSSPLPSDTANCAPVAPEVVVMTPAVPSTSNVPPAAPPTPAVPTATTLVGGPSPAAPPPPSPPTSGTCCGSPNCGGAAPCPTPAAP